MATFLSANHLKVFITLDFSYQQNLAGDIKRLDPTAANDSYVMDPDDEGGLEPFNVACDMTDKNGVGVTVISHDSEHRTLVDGCDAAGCYQRDIHYTGASLVQLAGLTRVSAHCEQFIKYEVSWFKVVERWHSLVGVTRFC